MVALFQRPSTVLHGADQAGLFANRPKSANNGHVYFADDLQRALIFNSRLQTWMPSDGNNLAVGAEKYLVDAFRGPILDGSYAVNSGSEGTALDPVILTTSTGGVVNGVSGSGDGSFGSDNSMMSYPLGFKPSDGRSVHHYRFAIDDITTVAFFVGLTDTATEQEAWSLTGTTYTSTATDSVGFLFDTDATADTIRAVGVKAGVDDTVDTVLAPVNDTFIDFSIDLSILGVAKMYINEALVATLAAAIDPAMAGDMHAVIHAISRVAATRTFSMELQVNHLLLAQS